MGLRSGYYRLGTVPACAHGMADTLRSGKSGKEATVLADCEIATVLSVEYIHAKRLSS